MLAVACVDVWLFPDLLVAVIVVIFHGPCKRLVLCVADYGKRRHVVAGIASPFSRNVGQRLKGSF